MSASRGSERLLQKYLKEALWAFPQTSTPIGIYNRDTCHPDAVAQKGQIPWTPPPPNVFYYHSLPLFCRN